MYITIDDPFEDTVEIMLTEPVKGETEKALLVVYDGDEDWIPKGQISPYSSVNCKGDTGKLIITRWIAEQKGLV